MPKYVNLPSEERLKEITEEFETLWGFPQVIGATDGSHISILKLIKSASNYYNRKRFYSIILQGVVGYLLTSIYLEKFMMPEFFQIQHFITNWTVFPDWKKSISGTFVDTW